MRASRRILASFALLLALGASLTACGTPIEGSVGSGNGAEIDIGGTEIPDDFPSTVPIIGGEVVRGSSVGGDDGKVWNVSIRSDDATVIDKIEVDLEDAGFDVQVQVAGDTAGTIVAEGSDYTVIVAVTEDDDEVVANYTVTTKGG